MMISESQAARCRSACKTASNGDSVEVSYTTQSGNRRRKRGEVGRAHAGGMTVKFPDGQEWRIIGTSITGKNNNTLRGIRLLEGVCEPESVHVLRGHSRVDRVTKRGDDEWVAYIEGNSSPIVNVIERCGGTIVGGATGSWNPEKDPRPIRFKAGDGS